MAPSSRSLALLAGAVMAAYLFFFGTRIPASFGAEVIVATGGDGVPVDNFNCDANCEANCEARRTKLVAELADSEATIAKLRNKLITAEKNAAEKADMVTALKTELVACEKAKNNRKAGGVAAAAAATGHTADAPNGYDPMPAAQRIRIVTAPGAVALALGATAIRVDVKTAAEIWAAGGSDNAALAVMTASTYPGIGNDVLSPKPRSATAFSAQIMDARVGVARWDRDGVFVGLFTREYNNYETDPAVVQNGGPLKVPAAKLNLPWAQPADRVSKLGPIWSEGIIHKQCDSVAKYIFGRIAMRTPSPHGTHALLFTHDWPLKSLHETVRRHPCEQPATWLMFTIREEHWRVPGIKAIVTPFELAGNWSRDFYAGTGPRGEPLSAPQFPAFATRKSVIMWRGAKKWDTVRRKAACAMSDQIRVEAARNGVEPWFDAQDSMANHSLNVNRDGQAQYKYLMDIGGESGTTWVSLNWKMATGALVFKVNTGSINWWYPFLIPGQDHLYVLSDFSNLRAQFDWAEANPTRAAEIAELGRRKALYFGRQDVQDAYHDRLLNNLNATAQDIFRDFPKHFPPPDWGTKGAMCGGAQWADNGGYLPGC